jgi:AmmeMemoRadiSam system protein B
LKLTIQTFPVETPALRPLEISPVRDRTGMYLLVRDPAGVIDGAVVLPADPLLLIVLQLADGHTTIGEIASKATHATGQIISIELLRDMVMQLDEAYLLLTDRFVEAWEAKREEFAKVTVRAASVFRVETQDRLKMLADLGAEFRRHTAGHDSPPADLPLPRGAVNAIFAPHIDYIRGGEVYNWSYRAIAEHGVAAETYFILGVVHRPAMHRFIATKKAWETPFGTVECDTALLDEFEKEFGGELYVDEYQHVTEHSIELQVVYLKKLLGDRPFKIVPILVSSFNDLLEADGSPMESDPEVAAFINALKKIMDSRGDRMALIGGVDFSHCGPEFGDEEPNSPERMKSIEVGDKAALDAIGAVDAEKFFDSFRPDLNARKVCSVGPIYIALSALKGRSQGIVQKYVQSNSNDKNCLVSFASVAFVKEGVEVRRPGKIILLS